MVRETGGEKNNSVYKQKPNTCRRGLRKELMLSTIQNLFQLFICKKSKKIAIRKTTYLPRKSVEKGVKELGRNKTHIL